MQDVALHYLWRLTDVDAQHHHVFGVVTRDPVQNRRLDLAGGTPSGPKIEHHDFALEVAEPLPRSWFAPDDHRQGEVRCRLVEQSPPGWRQPGHDEHAEHGAQRDQRPDHQVEPSFAVGLGHLVGTISTSQGRLQ